VSVATTGDAICRRTRSRYPLEAARYDPDEFDRLLAEFDPDVQLLQDDDMYNTFLAVSVRQCAGGWCCCCCYWSHRVVPGGLCAAAPMRNTRKGFLCVGDRYMQAE
jgi:hypothetical protein